jgi:hypothetical protein
MAMVPGIQLFLAITAFILVILSIINPPKVPLWVAVLILSVIELIKGLAR